MSTAGFVQAAPAGASAGQLGALLNSIPAIDPSNPGRIYVPDPGYLRISQYTATIAGVVLTGIAFDKAFGWDVIPGAPAGLESCTTVTTCQASQPTTGGTGGSDSIAARCS